MQSAKAKGKTQNLILRPHRKIIKAKAIFKKMMMKQQWLLSQSQFLYDPFKSGHVKCIFLESGQFSSKWGKALPQKLFYRHTKKGARCIHIDFKDILQFRHPAAALIVTNALMMTTPLDALAQTCEADTSVSNMPLLLLVALVGATVGGLLARQRKAELQRLNEQLRQINTALRRQANIESYAPTLSYAPVGGKISVSEVIIDPKKEELISHLKSGKNFLRNQALEKAFLEFKTALKLAQDLKDPIEEKKAARGLGASLQRQGKYKEAIEYHSMVLDISGRNGEESGSTEAYGAIADCYTELGDIERAAKYYDKYIARLQSD